MNRNVLVAGGLFALLLVVFVATREKQVSVGIKKMKLAAVDKDAVAGFEVSGAKAFGLKRESNGWLVWDPAKADKKYPVEESSLNGLLDGAAELKGGDHVSDDKAKHAEYEVDDAKGLRVKVVGASGPLAEVILGKGAKGGGTYIRLANEDSVFVTKSRLGAMLKRDVAGWRKRQMVSQKADTFRSITVTPREGTPFVLESADGKEWKLKDGTPTPAGFRFDAAAPARLAGAVANLRAQDFVEDAKPEWDGPMGLSGPHAQVVVTAAEGKGVTVHVGREPPAMLNSWAGTLKTNFDAVDAAKAKDGRITPEDLAAVVEDKARPEDLRKAAENAAKPEVFALLDTGVWSFRPADGGVAQEDLDAATKQGGTVPVRVEGDAQVYLVGSWAAQQLTRSLTDLRDLSLMSFDVEKARKLTINAGKPVTVEKKDGAWVVTDPKKLPDGFEFEGSTVVSQLNMLKSIKGSRLMEGVADAAAGLQKPTATVEVELEDGKKVALKLGKDTTNDKGAKEVFARGNADGALYAVPEYSKTRLGQGVELFKKPKPPPGMGGMGGGMGGMQGLEGLPPDVRKKIEEQLRAQGR